MEGTVTISSSIFWCKIIDMLQQNWASIEQVDGKTVVYFFSDTSGVFDEKAFPSVEQAQRELEYNGFELFDKSHGGKEFISVPVAPFRRDLHPNGKIYSSGRFWRMPNSKAP